MRTLHESVLSLRGEARAAITTVIVFCTLGFVSAVVPAVATFLLVLVGLVTAVGLAVLGAARVADRRRRRHQTLALRKKLALLQQAPTRVVPAPAAPNDQVSHELVDDGWPTTFESAA